MSISELYPWRKPDSLSDAIGMARKAFGLGPLLVYFKLCDISWNPKATLKQISRRARGVQTQELPRLRRKRALTNPLPDPHGILDNARRYQQRLHNQARSHLLTRLPLDIRQIVYEEVLAGGEHDNVVHIIRKHTRFGHWRCRLQTGQCGIELCDSYGTQCLAGWLLLRSKIWRNRNTERIDLVTDDGLLPLLLTCRAIYSEAIKVLYSKNIFHFYDPGDIPFFTRSIVPQRVDTIRSVIIDWESAFSIFNPNNYIPKHDKREWIAWSNTWRLLSMMHGLLEVRVILRRHQHVVTVARRQAMCQPMWHLTDLRVFELIIPFDDRQDWSFASGAPFKVVKAPLRPGYGPAIRDH